MATSLPQSAHLIARWSSRDITPQADNTSLASWTDSVGSFAATQATSGNQPKYRTNRIGSIPSVQFTAASQHMLQVGRPASVITALDARTATVLIIYRSTGNDTGALVDLGNDGTGTMIQTTGTTVGRFSDAHLGSIPFAAQTGFSVVGMTVESYTNGNGTNNLERWYVNSTCVGHAPVAASGPGASGHLAIGGDYTNAAFFNASFEAFEVLFFDVALTPDEMVQAQMWACDDFAQAYPLAGRDHLLVFDGDSISMGLGANGVGNTYPYKVAQALGLSYGQWTNIGVGGDTMANMEARASAGVDAFAATTGLPVKLAVFEWYNQAGADPTPRNASLSYLANRRAAGAKVIFGTSTDTDATTDANRAAYNAYFDANHSTATMDAYVAIHLDPNIGVETAYATNPSYWDDGVHLSATGYTFLAALFTPVIPTVGFAPIISAQPEDQYVTLGQYATFSITATASDGGSLSYQWQSNASGSFADITGATSSTYTVAGSYANNRTAFRCVLNDSAASTTSSSALLLVLQCLAIPAWLLPEAPEDAFSALDVSAWAGADLRVEKWVADELSTSSSGPDIVSCGVGAAIGAGATASVVLSTTVSAQVGQATGQGAACSISLATRVQAQAGQAIGQGSTCAVSLATHIDALAGQAVGAGSTCTVSATTRVAALAGAAVGAGATCTVSATTRVAGQVGQAIGQGASCSVSAATRVAASVGQAVGAGATCAVSATTRLACQAGAAVGQGLPCSVSVAGQIDCAVGAAVGAGSTATISSTLAIACAAGAAVGAGGHATVSETTLVPCAAGGAVAAGSSAAIVLSTRVAAGIGQAAAVGRPATIAASTVVSALAGAATGAGAKATIAAGVRVSGRVAQATAAGLQAGITVTLLVSCQVGRAIGAGAHASVIAIGEDTAHQTEDIKPYFSAGTRMRASAGARARSSAGIEIYVDLLARGGNT